MKTSNRPVSLSLFSTVIFFAVCGASSAQQGSYYQPQQESGLKRVGRSVSDFFRRSFYGEPPPAYQTPAYRQPGGTARSYSLDAPPSAHGHVRSQSYGKSPQYQTPPQSASTQKRSSTSARSTRTASKPGSSTASRGSSSGESKKRYSPPSKPSSFKKAPSHPVEERDEPASVTAPSNPPLPLPNSTPEVESGSTPPPPGSTEARLSDPRLSNTFPLPGASPKKNTDIISPTYSSDPINLEPAKAPVEDAASSSTSSSSTAKSGSFLVGRKTSKPGRVISPYAPYNELDVAGLPSGSLALDPTTQKVFQVP
jgi:hypothetical protein